jgi:hypothetical protein
MYPQNNKKKSQFRQQKKKKRRGDFLAGEVIAIWEYFI